MNVPARVRTSRSAVSGDRRDAGRVSVFIAVAFTGVLMVFGVAVDGTGQLRTLMRADNIAAEAGRAAGQAVDPDLVAAQGDHRVNQDLAVEYANTYLATAGHDDPDMSYEITLVDEGTAVQITVQLPYRNRVLGMFGRSDVQLTATSTAVLVTEP